jgi:GMP synthase-like glutamine amidotransferase
MRVAVIENTRATHHGQVGVALNEAGLLIDVFRPYAGERLPQGPNGYAGLVVFGGEQSAVDDALHPYLPDLARLMRAWGEAGAPVLGICLGSQVLARGYGGANHVGTAPEFGWCEVRATAAGRADPVLSAVPERFRSFQWHSDTFALPPGAVQLAEGEAVAHQAYRMGERVYGMQFHFEASQAVVRLWAEATPGDVEEMAPGWLAAQAAHAARHGAEADAAGLALARAWVRLLG